ncbi:MAG: hypothetical protein WBY53_09030 [Acidobacteriaceae bacterium]
MGTTTGLGLMGSSTSLLDMKEQQLIQQTASAATTRSDDAKIDKGAQQFESILVGTWLKEAEQSFATVPGGDSDGDAGGEQMMSLGVQTLSNALAASGGIGIGKMVAKAMHAAADKAQTAGPAAVKETGRE